MNEKTYKVMEAIDYFSKFNKEDIQINSKTKEFNINFNKNGLPHLLGIHYTEKYPQDFKSGVFLNKARKNRISDQDILDKVEYFQGQNQRNNVENRINTFAEFMKNLEKGFIVHKTLESKMNVNYLIVQTEDGNFKHLGVLSGRTGTLIETYEDLSEKELSILKTYFVGTDNDYYKNSKLIEPLESLKIYDEKLEQYINFSFDEDKQRFLNQHLGMDYQECMKQFYEEKDFDAGWIKSTNKSMDFER